MTIPVYNILTSPTLVPVLNVLNIESQLEVALPEWACEAGMTRNTFTIVEHGQWNICEGEWKASSHRSLWCSRVDYGEISAITINAVTNASTVFRSYLYRWTISALRKWHGYSCWNVAWNERDQVIWKELQLFLCAFLEKSKNAMYTMQGDQK